ncbi:MAG TPA: TrkA C-terminal domain-containing protein [Anaerolineae bacterium]|nr:transporter [Anaerolineae bacterium]HRV93200.1 TrkA C-terminal domain-containing protein [Anaerolineae bacterium]
MIKLLGENPLLLFFVVTALGYTLGRLKIVGVRLGSAAILFVGLVFGALGTDVTVPGFIVELGLVIFVYAIGLSNGANFFLALRREGPLQISFILFFLTLPFLLLVGIAYVFGLNAATAAGLLSGVGTNTAAFAAVLDSISTTAAPGSLDTMIAAMALAFAIAYPIGVLGRIGVIAAFQQIWQIDYAAEAQALRNIYPAPQNIIDQAIEITRPEVTGIPVRELQRREGWDIIFGRLGRNGQTSLINGDTRLQLGDTIAIAGETEQIDQVIATAGRVATNNLLRDYSIYSKRRLFVSNPEVVGQSIAALDLKERFGAIVTRLRRGDTDILPARNTILEQGDRIRILARWDDIPKLVELFGDSYEAVSQVNLLSLGYGITLGLLVGMVSLTLPGDIGFQIGYAGGTLIVALILGSLRRTGSIVWTLPYSANQTLQQMGLIMLLAGIGIRSGNALEHVMLGNTLIVLILVSLLLVTITAAAALIVGYKVLGLPFSIVAGMIALQPAVFTFVSERAKTHLPNIGFTMGIPLGLIINVVYAQVLYLLLSR